jgi:hypothetical protein
VFKQRINLSESFRALRYATGGLGFSKSQDCWRNVFSVCWRDYTGACACLVGLVYGGCRPPSLGKRMFFGESDGVKNLAIHGSPKPARIMPHSSRIMSQSWI